MADVFFEHYSKTIIDAPCEHLNNDTISCNDCYQLLVRQNTSSFQETQNYFPRRLPGNVIKSADLNGMTVPEAVFDRAQDLFRIVAEKRIYRGSTRIGVIAGCLIHAYKMEKMFISFKEIITSLGITNKKCLVGLQEIDLCLYEKNRALFEELSKNNQTFKQCTNDLAQKLCIDVSQANFEKCATKINKHCRITTAAAVALWLYIQETKMPISIEQIAAAAELSLTTIKKAIALPN